MTLYERLSTLNNNDGLTMKAFNEVIYKTGYQVATEGIETKDINEAVEAMKRMNGNCGVWYSDGVYYIDKSHRVATKTEALKVGREHNQISVLKWSDMSLVYC